MNLLIKIQQQSFKICVGKGFNDWVWLAHNASRIYSKTIYPQGTYLPTALYLQNSLKHTQLHPHPRQKIITYLTAYNLQAEQLTCIVKLRKANHSYYEFQKKWEKQAYQKEQYFMTFNFTYIASNINRKKDFYFKVTTEYNMADQVRHLFSQTDYPSHIQTTLQDRKIGPNESKFQATLVIPWGIASHKLFYLQKQAGNDQYTCTQLSQKKIKKQDFLIRCEPMYVARSQTLLQVQASMRIEQDISKSLQQKQLQTKKRNASSSLCCFNFQQLWNILQNNYSQELSLDEYEASTIQRIKLTIEKSLNQLYQIFFYYFIIENQQKDKKEELGLVYQHVMHFLRDYQVLPDMTNLTNFLQFYNSDESKFKRVQDTLDINHHSIRFPQFIVILLRSIQFVQTSTFLMKGETFDSAAAKIIERVAQKDGDLTEFTQFRRNLRQNAKIISFMRSNSEKLKQVFNWMCKKSIQFSSTSYVILKQQLKQLLITFSLVESNTDKLINECFKQLKLNQDGIFYYQFLIVVEWLAMAIVADQKDQPQNQEEQSMVIVEKIKYFLDKIQLD